MNALTTTPVTTDDEVIRVLENSLYPGAKRESIALVLSYCRVNGIDPMLKPVHIVPTNVKVGEDKWEYRDVLMPGIADYRIKAARSGEYGGKTEPEFGPERHYQLSGTKVTAPEWCKVTVSRIVQGHARAFTAIERWLENYAPASRKTEAPNTMWRKRAYGQLAKCTEAQALRMAFPEFSPGVTAEEMEGKSYGVGPVIEHEPAPSRPAAEASMARERINAEVPIDPPAPKRTIRAWLDEIEKEFSNAATEDQANATLQRPDVMDMETTLQGAAKARYEMVKAAMLTRIYKTAPGIDDVDEFIASLRTMPLAEVEALEDDAEHMAWREALSQTDYASVAAAITDRVIARGGA
jgi:phage recombination protein Bet